MASCGVTRAAVDEEKKLTVRGDRVVTAATMRGVVVEPGLYAEEAMAVGVLALEIKSVADAADATAEGDACATITRDGPTVNEGEEVVVVVVGDRGGDTGAE